MCWNWYTDWSQKPGIVGSSPTLRTNMPLWWNGRHGRLKIYCRKACRFKSGGGYHHFSEYSAAW